MQRHRNNPANERWGNLRKLEAEDEALRRERNDHSTAAVARLHARIDNLQRELYRLRDALTDARAWPKHCQECGTDISDERRAAANGARVLTCDDECAAARRRWNVRRATQRYRARQQQRDS